MWGYEDRKYDVMRHHCDVIMAKRSRAEETKSMDDFTKKRIMNIMDSFTKNAVPEHLNKQIEINYKIRSH